MESQEILEWLLVYLVLMVSVGLTAGVGFLCAGLWSELKDWIRSR